MLLRNLLLLSSILLLGLSAFSQEVTISPQPAWLHANKIDPEKKPNTKNISNGYYLELYDHQVHVPLQTEYKRIIRSIENENGVQNASEVSVVFSPQYQKVIFHKISLIRNGREVYQVSLNNIQVVQEEQEADQFLYNGTKRAFVILKDVRKGDKVDVAYSVKGFNPAYLNVFSKEFYFTRGTEIVNFFNTLITSSSRPLKIKLYNGAASAAQTNVNNNIIYHWSNPTLAGYTEKPGIPAWLISDPYVCLTEFNNWSQVRDWGLGLFKEQEKIIDNKIKQLSDAWKKESNGNKEVYAAKAIRFVQDEIRYLGLEIGTNTHIPYSPSKVIGQRYGDCKDKSLLLTVLLRLNEIPAHISLVNSDIGETMNERAPSQLEFNHAIVAIEFEKGKYKFIDPTIAYQRGPAAQIFTPNYGYALLLKSDVNDLVRIEPGPIKHIEITEKIKVNNNGEPSRLYVESKYKGGAADNNRFDFKSYSTSELEENYQKYYSRYYDSVILEKDIQAHDDSINNIFLVEEEYSIPQLWSLADDGRDKFAVFAKTIYDLLPNPKDNYKDGPLAIRYPVDVLYRLKLEMPSEWNVSKNDMHIRNDVFQFNFKIKKEGDSVMLEYRFVSLKDHISVNEMAQYKKDYSKINEILEYTFYHRTADSEYTDRSKGNYVSLLTLCLLLTTTILVILIFNYFNKQSAPTLFHPKDARPLGGWMIVLGLSFALSLILQIVSVCKNFVLYASDWDTIHAFGGSYFQLVAATEIIVTTTWILWLIANSYWFLKRRDIFPKMFTSYIALVFLGRLLILVSYHFSGITSAELTNIQDSHIRGVGQIVVYALIWLSYVYRSDRSKITFILPYRYIPTNSSEAIEDGSQITKNHNSEDPEQTNNTPNPE